MCDLGRLVVDKHVTRAGNELKLRLSPGIQNAMVDRLCATSWDQRVLLAVKE